MSDVYAVAQVNHKSGASVIGQQCLSEGRQSCCGDKGLGPVRSKLSGFEPVHGHARRAASTTQCTTLDRHLPWRVRRIAAAGPKRLVPTTQGHLTGQFGVSLVIPFFGQVRPPNRHKRVVRCSALLYTADRAARVMVTPLVAGSFVWWMTL